MAVKTPSGAICCPTCDGNGFVLPQKISLGMRVAIARKAKGLTQAELAPGLQIGRAQLANIEGDRSAPSILVLAAIAKKLGVTTDHLLGVGK